MEGEGERGRRGQREVTEALMHREGLEPRGDGLAHVEPVTSDEAEPRALNDDEHQLVEATALADGRVEDVHGEGTEAQGLGCRRGLAEAARAGRSANADAGVKAAAALTRCTSRWSRWSC